MAMRGRYSFGERREVDVWPGWVDALSSLLMVVIFLLMVFLVSQFYLSTIVSGRDETVGRLNRQVSELTDRLALEQEGSRDLQGRIDRLSSDLAGSARERADLGARLTTTEQDRDAIDRKLRDALAQIQSLTGSTADRDAQLQEAARVIQDNQATIERQRRELAQLQADMTTLRSSGQDRDLTVTDLSTALAQSRKEASDLGETLQERQAELNRAQDQGRSLQAQLDAARSATAASQQDVRDLTARVDQLNARIAELSGTLDRATAALQTEKSAGDTERDRGRQLAAEAAALRQQLSQIESTLRQSEASVTAKDLEIANLSSRLNQALVRKVDELSRSRSAFFGRLRDVLGDRPDVRVVGDRFVFQSEVLFPVGSAELQEGGKQQLAAFAATLKRIALQFPADVDWLLRIDGHTDRQPLAGTGQFASNWELSSARALSVLHFLASEGIPARRMAAAGFGEYQPLDTGDSPDAYRRNRRIELRLDQRGENAGDGGATPQ